MEALSEYPEFLMAGLLLPIILWSMRNERGLTWPSALLQPAMTVLAWLPQRYLDWINRTLVYAGWRSNLSFGNFASFKLYLPLLSLIALAFCPSYLALLLALALWALPDLWLALCASRRQQEIHKSLPQALDLMVLCVDAGLGLDATLQRIATEDHAISNALNEELGLLGREILLGMDRERSYLELYQRTGVDELKTLGSALGQANKLGLSIAKILRAQSEFIRKRQSQRAEEKAMKMPIYMAFPLWFFIMPALMLLVLGPSLIRFYHTLASAAQPF